MPTVTFDKKTVLKYLGKSVPDDVLRDRISMIGTDLEKVDDKEIIVEIFPNRPDMLSEEGFARAISAFIGIKPGFREYKVEKVEKVEKSGFTTTNANPLPYWPYVVTGIVKGLAFNDERIRQVIQLQEKLGVTLLRRRKKGGIGLYPLDKIKMPIKFTSEAPEKIKYRPLEYPDVLSGKEILLKHPAGREYAHICKDWPKLPVFVDAAGTIMSMPPVINSHDVGKVTESTKDVFLEATGTDLRTLNVALNILAAALADMGGKLYSMQIIHGKEKFDTPDLSPRKMKIDLAYANRLLGLSLKDSEVKALLAKMGHGYVKGSVLIPAYRDDILHPFDIVEDIAVAYGYEKFREEIPNVMTIGHESRGAVVERKLAEIMAGYGFLECMSYHLSNKETLLSKMNMPEQKLLVQVSNAVNVEYDTLRQSLLPGLMKILSENTLYEYPQKLFEIGRAVNYDASTETGTKEIPMLAGAVASMGAGFSEAKAMVEGIFHGIGKEISLKEAIHPSFLPGRVAELFDGKESVGFVGELHPKAINNFGIEVPVAGFEIRLDFL